MLKFSRILWIKNGKRILFVSRFYHRILLLTLAAAACTAGTVANAKEAERLPVYEGDIDKPYVVVGEIKDNLRKPFPYLPNPTKEKIMLEIWERARKLGADAVINLRYGETKQTLFDHGRTPISGKAIKFIPAED